MQSPMVKRYAGLRRNGVEVRIKNRAVTKSEATQRSDVKSYATEISYSFDRYSPFAVHDKLSHITDDELRGSDTHVQILTVDTFITTGDNARLREWAVIPDTSGDGTDRDCMIA